MANPEPSRWPGRRGVHGFRVALFVSILVLIHFQYSKLAARTVTSELSDVGIDLVRDFLPSADLLDDSVNATGGIDVLDGDGTLLGHVIQTSPDSDSVVGFSGPTNVLLAFDVSDELAGARILSSGDTPAHLRQVEKSDFLTLHFVGRTKRELTTMKGVDGVSGATLTSLAMQEGIRNRLGGAKVSLRFPRPLELSTARHFFPDASTIEQNSENLSVWEVRDEDGKRLGKMLRTSPSSDSQIGYQGPTNSVIGLDSEYRVIGVLLGKTYDNEAYVKTIRGDDYFLNLFNGKSLAELGELDLETAEVEGVSGATMTSMAVARGLLAAARDEHAFRAGAIESRIDIRAFTLHDFGTVLIILLGVLIGFTRVRRIRYVRWGFPMLLIVYLGLVNGDMLSQAMLVGWARHGIPWTGALGLVFLSGAALLIPITSRRNIYCHHICPHGAAQRLLRRVSRRRILLPRSLRRVLASIPGILLAVCVLIAMTSTTFSLVDVEPFDAWVFRVAGWVTMTIAIVGLVASVFIPMAYCRFGCPTGFLLNFLRMNAGGNRLGRADWAGVVILIVSLGIYLVG